MSSTKLSGLGADAGSGSDDDGGGGDKPTSRSIVVAIEKTDDGLSAVKFAAENVLRGEVSRKIRGRVWESACREGCFGFEEDRSEGRRGKHENFFVFASFPTSTSTSSFFSLSLTLSSPRSFLPPLFHPPLQLPTHQQDDTLHILHVAKIMSAREEVAHGMPGTSLSYRDESLAEVKKHVEEARAWLREVIVPAATEAARGSRVKVHLFVDKTTASSDDLAKTLAKAADDLDAAVLVLSKSNKTALDRLFLGSVAGKTQRICGRPVLLVTSGSSGGGGA
jgi:nucleotide-binding universal stress UspA family protein